MMQQTFKIPPKMFWLIKHLYGLPASITIVTGWWKTGKTDFSLLLTELTQQLGVISKFGSNIETQNSNIEFINNFTKLDFWLYESKQRKIFLYDEVMESAPSRRAMSTININWVQRIPQLSKARCHLVAITQEENLSDSVFRNRTFCRGIWRKLNKTTLIFEGPYFSDKTLRWENLPKTNIIFDPYLTSSFKLSESSMAFDMLPIALKVLMLYGDGESFSKIQTILNINHPEVVRRLLKRACHAVSLTVSQQPSEGNKLKEICDKTE